MDPDTISLFKPPRRFTSHVRLVPPSRHQLPSVTGGLGRLYEKIKKQEAVTPFDYVKYTHSDGSFCPALGMPLLVERYDYVDVIGQGQSSILIKAKDTFQSGRDVAIKILHTHYSVLGSQEANCLQSLNASDPHGFSPILRLLSIFCFGRHFCLVFELLDCVPISTLFHQMTSPQERLRCIRKVALRMINAVGFLQSQNVIHADLKPDNLRLSHEGDLLSLKVVDFGNAIHCIHDELSLYYEDFELQTLLYRAPEVIFGLMFGMEVDLWSVGCILAELYLGRPLFQGGSIEMILTEMQTLLGPLPKEIFQRGKFFQTFENFTRHCVKPIAINDVMRQLDCSDFPFVDFLLRLLKYEPANRMTVGEAAEHPFLAAELGLKYFQMKPCYDSSSNYAATFLRPETYCHPQKRIRRNGASDLSPPQSTLQSLEALTYPMTLKFLPRKIEQLCDPRTASKPNVICKNGAEKSILKRKLVERPKARDNNNGGISQLTVKTEPVEFREAVTDVGGVLSEVGFGVEISRTGQRSTELPGLDGVDQGFLLNGCRIVGSVLLDGTDDAKVIRNPCNNKQRRLKVDRIHKTLDKERVPTTDQLAIGEVANGILGNKLKNTKALPRVSDGKDSVRTKNLRYNPTVMEMVVQREGEAGEVNGGKGETGREGVRLLRAVSSEKSPGNQNHSNLELESIRSVDGGNGSEILELDSAPVVEESNLVSSRSSSQNGQQLSTEDLRKTNDSLSKKNTVSNPRVRICSPQSNDLTGIANRKRTSAIVEVAPRKSDTFTDESPRIPDKSASKIVSIDIISGDVSENVVTSTLSIHKIWQTLSKKKQTCSNDALTSLSNKKNSSVEENSTEIPVRGVNGDSQLGECKLNRYGTLMKSAQDPTERTNSERDEVLDEVEELDSCPARPVSSSKLSSGSVCQLVEDDPPGRLPVEEEPERMPIPGLVTQQTSSCDKRPPRNSHLDSTFIVEDIPAVGFSSVTIPKSRARSKEGTQPSGTVIPEPCLNSSSCSKGDKYTSNRLDVTFSSPPNPRKDSNLDRSRAQELLSPSVSLVTTDSEPLLNISSSRKRAPNTSNCLDITFSKLPNPRKDTNRETSLNFISSVDSPVSNHQKLDYALPIAPSKKSIKSPRLGSSVTSANTPEACELESAKVTQLISPSYDRPPPPKKRRKLEPGSDNHSVVLPTEPKSPCVNSSKVDSVDSSRVANDKGKKPQAIGGRKPLVKGGCTPNRKSKAIPGGNFNSCKSPLNETFQLEEPAFVGKEQNNRWQHKEVSSPGGAVALRTNETDCGKSFEFVGNSKRNLYCPSKKRKGSYAEYESDCGELDISGYTLNRSSVTVRTARSPRSASTLCLVSDDDDDEDDDDEVVTLTP